MSTEPPHPSAFIREEMNARGWTRWQLARRMGGDYIINLLCIDLYFEVGPATTNMRFGDMADSFALAFDVSPDYFRNLETLWLAERARARREE
jgi:plasmid maintenance system antidote protein VapI